MSVENSSTAGHFTIDSRNGESDDLRLHRAFNAWLEFKENHLSELAAFASLSIEEIGLLSDEVADSVLKAITVELDTSPRNWINVKKLGQLTEAVSGEGNRVAFIRHAEQSPPEWIYSISHPGIRKIRMMQQPFNKQDFITNESLAETFAMGTVFLYIQAKTGKHVYIRSSENMRALEIANIFHTIIPQTNVETDEGLTCITYKDEKDLPSVQVEQLIENLDSGIMPWEPELVDQWCKRMKSGKRPSEAIKDAISRLYQDGRDAAGNDLYIILTHSQQLAEALRLAGKLKKSSTRYPELSIFIASSDDFIILRRGVLHKKVDKLSEGPMRAAIEKSGEGYQLYKVRREEFETQEKVPFLVAPEPFRLSKEEAAEIRRLGKEVVDFMDAVNGLYNLDPEVRGLLNRGKPELFQLPRQPHYLFVRPDLLITEQGVSICEIEVSPFGLALAELLNQAYIEEGFNTMVPSGVMCGFLQENTPDEGVIVYTPNTASYVGQMQFIANELLAGQGRHWEARHIDEIAGMDCRCIYRGFYLYECRDDLFINNLLANLSCEDCTVQVLPSLTPHMEEKALLALIWDTRWESYFRHKLGEETYRHLREVIPPTLIIGQEQFFAPGLPEGVKTLDELATLPRSKRNFVLKQSGFGHGSSWAEGVHFLQEKSAAKSRSIVAHAQSDNLSLYIIQQFRPSNTRQIVYTTKDGLKEMQGRLRITPYFSMVPDSRGQLLAIKATACENTNYIHASTASINTAVVS
ncbi:hypothetical protein A2164_01980 [Candidatus Curtissbacteria bacterium RBG_13_35_7]|uniref:Uncharacterized protein n=1 Tax=Candidatus Curtissbacteria bacterium RBG_13_35_7 TaxID=1797705 RepID=A0A1F5G2V5_9BACT|nr:MAG: hypothetical protein A2164_01980 [Candidatus Curtissbacteria bacterium RBG_13_35_7]